MEILTFNVTLAIIIVPGSLATNITNNIFVYLFHCSDLLGFFLRLVKGHWLVVMTLTGSVKKAHPQHHPPHHLHCDLVPVQGPRCNEQRGIQTQLEAASKMWQVQDPSIPQPVVGPTSTKVSHLSIESPFHPVLGSGHQCLPRSWCFCFGCILGR